MAKKTTKHSYAEDLRLNRSLLIVSNLQERPDVAARKLIEGFTKKLGYEPLHDLMIEPQAWAHVKKQAIPARLVFCHPAILAAHPSASLYYRGMTGLSIKAVKDYVGSVEAFEAGSQTAKLNPDKAREMARTYNLFISSIIVNSTNWTLENGHRTILATMGISLDGTMRNRVGDVGEDRIRRLVLEWLKTNGLLVPPNPSADLLDDMPKSAELKRGIIMEFSSEPDIAFRKGDELLATIEIKGGIDPAGALERYGAAKKSFEHAGSLTRRCRNFYVGGVLTDELLKRIREDRLVEQTFDLIALLRDPEEQERFFSEVFHHTLRIV